MYKRQVFISKKYIKKILEYIDNDDYDKIYKIIEDGNAKKYDAKDFNPNLITDLNNDLQILKTIKNDWGKIRRDPKLNTLIYNLNNNNILKNNKIIIFTESKETAEYLAEKINNTLNDKALLFHSESQEIIKNEVINLSLIHI